MINEKRKTCSSSDVQFVASYFAGWICAGDLAYATSCSLASLASSRRRRCEATCKRSARLFCH